MGLVARRSLEEVGRGDRLLEVFPKANGVVHESVGGSLVSSVRKVFAKFELEHCLRVRALHI